jgi:hypothetical protein
MNIIWNSRIDGKYECKVVRVDKYNGTLQIFDGEKEIFSKPVTLMYGAPFGPDVDDVALWQEQIINFIDNEYIK